MCVRVCVCVFSRVMWKKCISIPLKTVKKFLKKYFPEIFSADNDLMPKIIWEQVKKNKKNYKAIFSFVYKAISMGWIKSEQKQ